MTESITAEQLIDEARKLIGIRWQHQGRRHSGVDCIGLVVLAAQCAGLNLFQLIGMPDRRNYKRDPDPELLALVDRFCYPLPEPIPGCLIVMKFPGDRHARHFAIYTADNTIVHAESKHRGVIEHGYRTPWPRWQNSVWKLPGVIYGDAC